MVSTSASVKLVALDPILNAKKMEFKSPLGQSHLQPKYVEITSKQIINGVRFIRIDFQCIGSE